MERDLVAAMADGATLLADRWVPGPGSVGAGGVATAPIVLLRSPYGRHPLGIVGRLFAERGYQTVIQSCRGTFGSGGEWVPFRNERADGRDTLAWLAAQPWFSGRVATFGPSYLGLVQWAVCAEPPDFLLAMAPAVTATFFRDSVVYPSDVLALGTMLSWVHQVEHQELPRLRSLAAGARAGRHLQPGFSTLPLSTADQRVVGRRVGFFQDWLAHDQPGDRWWDPVDFRPFRLQGPPATFQAGWYDIFLAGQMADYSALRAAGREARITIGPWTHTSPGGLGASLRDALEFFDRHVRDAGSNTITGGGAGKASDDGKRVRLFVMGAKRWVDVADWPPPATPQRWHLHAGGRLDPAPPADAAPDRFRYDPADPTPSVGGASLEARQAGRKDQRTREGRDDVLVYTSAPLERDVTVAGPLAAHLHFRSSLTHTDVFVRLCVVDTRGRSYNVSDGIRRLGPDDGGDGSAALRVEMTPTAITFRRGERIRLQVSSGAHPLFARNPGSGEPLASATTLRAADQEVLHDPAHPSAIEVPVSTI